MVSAKPQGAFRLVPFCKERRERNFWGCGDAWRQREARVVAVRRKENMRSFIMRRGVPFPRCWGMREKGEAKSHWKRCGGGGGEHGLRARVLRSQGGEGLYKPREGAGQGIEKRARRGFKTAKRRKGIGKRLRFHAVRQRLPRIPLRRRRARWEKRAQAECMRFTSPKNNSPR